MKTLEQLGFEPHEWCLSFMDINKWLGIEHNSVKLQNKNYLKSISEVFDIESFNQWQLSQNLKPTLYLTLMHSSTQQYLCIYKWKDRLVLGSLFSSRADAPAEFIKDACRLLTQILKTKYTSNPDQLFEHGVVLSHLSSIQNQRLAAFSH